ncbi:hypothetical protein ATY77_02870 [Rhizobium sp. R634]|uniref:hypothetical protein n=1 Tax=Rhizobium sp. R634 TaxID=1764274 RepID=UPI000B52E47A|nr:hypothetical protein [Rhizobium sp. R634]OWV82198.1 hypothetical protein ATY77_02870 [Rhizobium sp. R634]
MDTPTQWAFFLGALTLASRIAAVFGSAEIGRHRQKAAEYLTFGLSAAAFVSAVAMVAYLVMR